VIEGPLKNPSIPPYVLRKTPIPENRPLIPDPYFHIRSPHRPNHIGFSIVKIKSIKENKMYFTEVDVLDETPLLDIKPYVKYFDGRDNVISGWADKHFKNGNIPDETVIK